MEADDITIAIDDVEADDITISIDDVLASTMISNSGPFTIGSASSSSYLYSTSINNASYSGLYSTSASNWGNVTLTSGAQPTPSLTVTGSANFESDIIIKGVSLQKTLNDIQSRLAILVPDPAKLEHFAALKKAYDNYKTLEALCQLPSKDD